MKKQSFIESFCRFLITVAGTFALLIGVLTLLQYHPYWLLPYRFTGLCLTISGFAFLSYVIKRSLIIWKIAGIFIFLGSIANLLALWTKLYSLPGFFYTAFETSILLSFLGLLLFLFAKDKANLSKIVLQGLVSTFFFFLSAEIFFLSESSIEGRSLFEGVAFVRPVTALVCSFLALGFYVRLILIFLDDFSLFRKAVPYLVVIFFVSGGASFSLRIWADRAIIINRIIDYRVSELKYRVIEGLNASVESLANIDGSPIKRESWVSLQVYDKSLNLDEKRTRELQISQDQPIFFLPEEMVKEIRENPLKKNYCKLYQSKEFSHPMLVLFSMRSVNLNSEGGVAVLISLDRFMKMHIQATDLEDYAISVEVQGIPCYQINWNRASIVSQYVHKESFSALDQKWTITIAPSPHYFLSKDRMNIFWISVIGGIIISFSIGLATYFWQKSHERLDALKKAEEQLQIAVSSADIGLASFDRKSQTFSMTKQSIDLFHLFPSQFLVDLSDFEKIIYPKDRAVFRKNLEDSFEKKSSFVCQFRIVWPDSTIRHILARGEIELDVLKGAFIDTTVLTEASEKIRKSEEKYQFLIESLDEWFFELDIEGRFIYSNSQVQVILGYNSEEILGVNYIFLVKDEKRREVTLFFKECIEKKIGMKNSQVEFIHKDTKPRFLELNMVPILSFEGVVTGFRCMAHDVTEKRKIESFKREFTANVNHDLRTPLSSIYGSLTLLTQKYRQELPEKVKDLIEIAQRNAQRLLTFVQQLLELETIDVAKMSWNFTTFPISQLIKESVELNNPVAENAKIRIQIEEPLSQSCVRADYDRLQEVLANLFANAIKFSFPEQVVTVSTLDKESYVRVFVKDQGRGIPKDLKPQIFVRFANFGINPFLQGFGIGLSLCESIISAFGGTIGFTSEEGKGTVFYFDLPIYPGEYHDNIS